MASSAAYDFSRRQVALIAGGVFVAMLLGWYLFGLFGAALISAAELRRPWKPDMEQFHRRYVGDQFITEKDFPQIMERFDGLRLDLRGETAQIVFQDKTWQGQWSAQPADKPAATILVRLGQNNSPIGRYVSFTRERGFITIAMDAIILPLRIDEDATSR